MNFKTAKALGLTIPPSLLLRADSVDRMNRRAFVTGLGAVLAAPLGVEAQQAGKMYRVAFLGFTSPSGYASQLEAFRGGLRDLGYVERQNIVIDFRWAHGKYDVFPNWPQSLFGRSLTCW